MKISIKEISDTEYEIDGITVFKDQNGNWVGSPLLTPTQIAVFQRVLKSRTKHIICPECLQPTDQEELDMFGGICEHCHEDGGALVAQL